MGTVLVENTLPDSSLKEKASMRVLLPTLVALLQKNGKELLLLLVLLLEVSVLTPIPRTPSFKWLVF